MTVSGLTEFKVSLSEEGVRTLEKLIENKGEDVPENIISLVHSKNASIEDIKLLHNYFKSDGFKIHELLGKSEVLLPQPVVEPRNPELEARVQRLRKMVEQQQYDKMTKNIRAKGADPDESIGAQLKFMNKQLIAVAQFVVSVGSGFAFGFYGIQLMVGELDFGFRLLLGVICSLVIALAEIYFLAKIIAELDLEGTVRTEEQPTPPQEGFEDTGQSLDNPKKLHQD